MHGGYDGGFTGGSGGVQKLLHELCHLLRLVVVQHVPGVLHDGGARVAHMGQALVVFGQAVFAFPPLAQAVVAGLHG